MPPRPTRPQRKTLALIATCREILEEIQPANVRAVCYILFNRKLIPSMSRNETGKVSKHLVTARELGLIPWEWIVDETREVERWAAWANPDTFMSGVQRSYRKDYWREQPRRLIVVSEKSTVGGILRPVLSRYNVPFLIVHGWSSATAIKNLADWTISDERTAIILYVGDHDPSGRYMSDVDIRDRVNRYGGAGKRRRIAVTEKHIAQYDLATFSAHEKKKDSNYQWFLETHGATCCELDALNPNDLRSIVDQAIRREIDGAAWVRAIKAERAEETALSEFLNMWPGMA